MKIIYFLLIILTSSFFIHKNVKDYNTKKRLLEKINKNSSIGLYKFNKIEGVYPDNVFSVTLIRDREIKKFPLLKLSKKLKTKDDILSYIDNLSDKLFNKDLIIKTFFHKNNEYLISVYLNNKLIYNCNNIKNNQINDKCLVDHDKDISLHKFIEQSTNSL